MWMKSLVLNGHGCTVYDSDGGIVYRVDNYGSARCGGGGVCLMDLHGTVVLNIVKRVLILCIIILFIIVKLIKQSVV